MDKKQRKWSCALAVLLAAAMVFQALWADSGMAFAAGSQEELQPDSSIQPVPEQGTAVRLQEELQPDSSIQPVPEQDTAVRLQEGLQPDSSTKPIPKVEGIVQFQEDLPQFCSSPLTQEGQSPAGPAAQTASPRTAKSTRAAELALSKEEQENIAEGWSWKKDSDSPLSYTLTLDSVNFEVPDNSAITLYASQGFPIENMNIALSGENRIISTNQTENSYNGCGIYINSNDAQTKPAVSISGTGSLTLKGNRYAASIGGSLGISGVSIDAQSDSSQAVMASGALSLENSSLKSKALSADTLSMRGSSLSVSLAEASKQGQALVRVGFCDIENSDLSLSGAEDATYPYAAISSNGGTACIRDSSVDIRNVQWGIEITRTGSSSICLEHVIGTLFCSNTDQYLQDKNPALYADQVEVSESTFYVQTGNHIFTYGNCSLPEEIKELEVPGNLSIEEGKSFTVGEGQKMDFTLNYATIKGGEDAAFINNGTVTFSHAPTVQTSFINNGRLDSADGIDCSHTQFTNNGTFHGAVKEDSGAIHYCYGTVAHNYSRTLGEFGAWTYQTFLMPGAALAIPGGKYLDASKGGITWDNLSTFLSMGEGSRITVEEGGQLLLPPNDTGNKFSSLNLSGGGTVKIGEKELFHVEFRDGETVLSAGFADGADLVKKPDAPAKEGCTFRGWYPVPEGGEPFDFSKPTGADIVLYAQWMKHVAVQEGSSVSAKGSITYGQALSELEFNPAIFVEEGTGAEAAGSLSWKNPEDFPKAGTASAEWVFTPEDSSCKTLEGTAAITVEKADPYISALPTASQITYGESLSQSALAGGAAQHQSPASPRTAREDGLTSANSTAGRDSPAIQAGYLASVSGKRTTQQTPSSATQAHYLASVSGDAQPSGLDGAAVAGSFSWKNSSQKPAVADSGKTEFAVIFTPTDTENYNSVETGVKLPVLPAEQPPNMPQGTMGVPNSCTKISAVTLPEGWQWEGTGIDTALLPGTPVKATAIYIGQDKGNYKNETAEITITRAACPHGITETRNAKAATCVEEGYTGDTFCTVCSETIGLGKAIPALGHSPKATVAKQPTKEETGVREYRCTVCGMLLRTETIPKLPETGNTSGQPQSPDEGSAPKPSQSPEQDAKAQKEQNAYKLSAGLKATQSGKSITAAWGKVKGADGYDVYIQYCGQKFTSKSRHTVKGSRKTKLTIKKINGKKLDLKKSYRIYVAAYQYSGGKKVTLGKSITIHFAAKNSKKYTNAKAVNVQKASFTLKKGKTAQIKPKATLFHKKKKLLPENHAKRYRYLSSSPAIASVSKTGKIKAKKKGACTICVFAQNGCKKKIKVKVQ